MEVQTSIEEVQRVASVLQGRVGPLAQAEIRAAVAELAVEILTKRAVEREALIAQLSPDTPAAAAANGTEAP